MLLQELAHWSLTTLWEKLVNIGAKAIAHERCVTFQLAEAAVPRDLFREILRLNRSTISANWEFIWKNSV